MRVFLTAAILAGVSGVPAVAVEYTSPVGRQLYTCAAEGVSRVALREEAAVAACCEGKLTCAQFLSTPEVVRVRREGRT